MGHQEGAVQVEGQDLRPELEVLITDGRAADEPADVVYKNVQPSKVAAEDLDRPLDFCFKSSSVWGSGELQWQAAEREESQGVTKAAAADLRLVQVQHVQAQPQHQYVLGLVYVDVE